MGVMTAKRNTRPRRLRNDRFPVTSSEALSTGQSPQSSNSKCFTFTGRISLEGFFVSSMALWGQAGDHWKGVNASLRENRIGHGADTDFKRGTYALQKLSEVLWLLAFLNNIGARHGHGVR